MDNVQVIIFAITVALIISVDIFFYTLAKATSEKLHFRNWTLPAALAHMILMGGVCGLFYYLGRNFEFMKPPLGIMGFFIITWYLYELMCKWRGSETDFSLTELIENKTEGRWLLSWLSPKVLAVSWDCIPVAAGVAVETEDLSVTQLFLWLLLIGITVAFFAQTSIAFASVVRRRGRDASLRSKILACLAGNWVVYSLLAGFGLLALIKGFEGFITLTEEIEVYHLLPFTGFLATLYFWKYWKEIWQTQAFEIAESGSN